MEDINLMEKGLSIDRIQQWTFMEVENWARQEGQNSFLYKFSKNFRDHKVDGTTLMLLKNESLLDSIGVTSETDKLQIIDRITVLKANAIAEYVKRF